MLPFVIIVAAIGVLSIVLGLAAPALAVDGSGYLPFKKGTPVPVTSANCTDAGPNNHCLFLQYNQYAWDFAPPAGTEIVSVAPGVVVNSRDGNQCPTSTGNFAIVRHDDGSYSQYVHMQTGSVVAKGTRVSTGSRIGQVGNTGNRTGPHLHFSWVQGPGDTCGNVHGTRGNFIGIGHPLAGQRLTSNNPGSSTAPPVTAYINDNPALYGPSTGWYHRVSSSGYAGDYDFSYGALGRPRENYAVWTWSTKRGRYAVACYIPGLDAGSTVKYEIRRRGGTSWVSKNQNLLSSWTSLGTFSFDGAPQIILGDNQASGSPSNLVKFGVDACKLTLVSAATAPSVPRSVSATAGSANATVRWATSASDGGSSITRYEVTASPGGRTCVTSGTGRSCTVTGLANGTSYSFLVRARNAVGPSSAVRSNTVTPATVPGAPRSVSATAENIAATVRWATPSSNGGSSITRYEVTASPGGRTCVTSGTGRSCTVTGLANGTSYSFLVRARNTKGLSAATRSNAVTPATAPSAPRSVSASAGNASASVSWSPPSSNGGTAITGYEVTASPSGDRCTTGPSGRSCAFTGLTNDVAYTFDVRVRNSVGLSSAATTSPVTPVAPLTVPTAPRSVSASPGDASVLVSWSPPSSTGGTAVTGYEVTASPSGAVCTTGGSGRSCTVTGLTNGTSYTFRVEVRNSVGWSPVVVSNAVTPEADGLPPPSPPPAAGHTVGLVDTSQGKWYLYDSTGNLVSSFFFGNPGDYPIYGDWNGDGIDTPGMYRQSDGYVYLRNANTQGIADIKFFFGNPGDVPLAGDFNGNGYDTVSIYRPSNQTFYIINKLGSNNGGLGAANFSYVFGNPGDKPFVGDFNGNGVETVGLHRESTGLVYFRNSHMQGNADSQFIFGDPRDRLVAGDWNDNGTFTPALFRPSNTTMYFRYTNTQGSADSQWTNGRSGWIPIAGDRR